MAEPASATRLSSDIGNIFHNGKFTDCTIVCEGREFKCHQNILAGRSSVFDAMFSHDMEEKRRGNVDIQDLDSDTVHDMIIYIYSGKVQGKLEGKATGLLSAAEKYDLKVFYQGFGLCNFMCPASQELKQMCEESLCTKIDTDNVLGMNDFKYLSSEMKSFYLLRHVGPVRPSRCRQCEGPSLEVYCGEWKGDCCSERLERKVKGKMEKILHPSLNKITHLCRCTQRLWQICLRR